MATHSSTLAWKIPWTEKPGRIYIIHGVSKSQTLLSDFTFTFPVCNQSVVMIMSSPNCCFLTCIQISQEPGQVVWYSQVYWHRTWESERWNDANIVLKSRTRIRYHFLKNRGKGLDFIECSVFALRDWYYIPYLTRKRNWNPGG